MQNGEIGSRLTQENDSPFDEGEPVYVPRRAHEAQKESRLDYSCISELGQGFKGMLGKSNPLYRCYTQFCISSLFILMQVQCTPLHLIRSAEEMSKDPREVERLKNTSKMRKQRSNTSATPRNTQSLPSSNNSISSSTTSSTRRSPTSTIISAFPKEEQSSQKEEETQVEEGLEILLAPLTARKTNPPTAHLADEPTLQEKQPPDSNASKGKSDLKQWASRLVTQKRRAKNTGSEKLRTAVPLANALSDVSEGGTPYRQHMLGRKPPQISTNSISMSFNPVANSASTLNHVNSTQMSEKRPTYDTEAYPDDEFNELLYNAVKVPHHYHPATKMESEGNGMRRQSDPAPEDETPIRTNTTSSKPRKINQTSSDMFFLPKADFNMPNNNPDQYAQSDLYQSKAQFMKPQLPPKQTRPIAPIAPPRQISSHIQGMPMNNKILMTPPPIKSRVPPHSLLHVNVVTPDYTAAPREIQKKSNIEPNALDVELATPKDLARSHHSTSSASIKNSTFDNLIHGETGEIAHLPPASISQTLSPRATVVATSKEVLVEQWLALKCPYLHPDDLRNYAKKLTDMGFDSKMMLENELRGDDLNFMKVAHKRVILSSLGL